VAHGIEGFGVATPLGIMGAVFHLFNHSIFKSLLFVNAAAVEIETGTTDMNKMGGIAQKMPVTGATSVVALLSTCGIPPLAGFWSKLIIIVALWQCGNYAYASLAILASILTLAYLLSMQRRVFFGKLASGFENMREARLGIMLISILLAAIVIGTGAAFPYVFMHIILPVNAVLLH